MNLIKMARKNSIPTRIDFELAKRIKEIAEREGLSDSQASKRILIKLKELELEFAKIKRVGKFSF